MRSVPRFFKTRADSSDDARLVQADRSEQLRLVAVIDEAVGKPQLEERGDDGARGERLGDAAPRTAQDRCRGGSAPRRADRARMRWRASGGIRSRRSASSPPCWERSAKS